MLALLRKQQEAFRSEMSPTRAVREDRLRRLDRLLSEHGERLAALISRDFGNRSTAEVRITELMALKSGVRHAMKHLSRWMKPRSVSTAPAFQPGRSRVLRQPLGVIGVVSPWNYPLMLSLGPLIGILAAGNRAMIKPSELTPLSSAALRELIADAFAPEEVTVVTGDAAVGRAFVSLPFDHLVFTGSTAVGREVAQAAAKNLTPVTLELGGKSPVIIDASCDMGSAIEGLAWGKLINSGQTCIAPDYALVPRKSVDRFVQALRSSMLKLYPTFRANPDYTSIVSDRHYQRLRALVEDARVRGAHAVELEPANGKIGHAGRQLAPTLLLNVNDQMRVMQEEIFGPILPIVPYDTLDDALDYVNRHERPLALYWFGTDRIARNRVLNGTIAGGVTINDALLHLVQEGLPFGGVGPSGQGHYHGEYGFRQFSKEKPVFIQSRFSGVGIIRPPYKPSLGRILAVLSRLN
ncbi:coniferyl aldehyde dehydrogenase [Burkholderia contaminans]|nr:coniferyl aldehyde dehydrogenase [Burkholderia contaminans]